MKKSKCYKTIITGYEYESEYAWMCLNQKDSEYASDPKNSEYDKVLNMRALHHVLNIPAEI